jgi:hypothetical protein
MPMIGLKLSWISQRLKSSICMLNNSLMPGGFQMVTQSPSILMISILISVALYTLTKPVILDLSSTHSTWNLETPMFIMIISIWSLWCIKFSSLVWSWSRTLLTSAVNWFYHKLVSQFWLLSSIIINWI